MASKETTRNVATGFQAVRFEGCDLVDGRAVEATAERISKAWGTTEEEAMRKL